MISRLTVALAVAAALGLSIWPARSDQYPTLNVAPLCHGITDQSDLQEGLRSVTFDQCMKAEQTDRETMIKEWPTFSASDKAHCIAEAQMGGESSYTDLVTCLEMARDVRALKGQAAAKPKQTEEVSQRKQSPRRTLRD